MQNDPNFPQAPVVPPPPPPVSPLPDVQAQSPTPIVPPSQTFASSMGSQMQGESPPPPGKKSDVFFKIVFILAILSVLVLLGALAYYLYSASQTGTSKKTVTQQVVAKPTPVVSPTAPAQEGSVLSESDEPNVVEAELTGTELEDFNSEFTALLKETEEL